MKYAANDDLHQGCGHPHRKVREAKPIPFGKNKKPLQERATPVNYSRGVLHLCRF